MSTNIYDKYAFDPELKEAVALLPNTDLSDPVVARENMREIIDSLNAQANSTGIDISDFTVPGQTGDPDVAVRLYKPIQHSHDAALLYIHGGGFVVGSIDSEHTSALSIAHNLQIPVLSVEYRLAPEHPFPAGLNDCYSALQWLSENTEALQVSAEKIAVFGQSAGGGLSAALALMSKQKQGPKLCFQFLGMPELDDRLDTTSMRDFTDTPLWNRPCAELSWKYYLGDQPQPTSILAAPARATREQLSGLPPAYISAMEFDPLRDEDVRYALQLMEAGVAVEFHSFPGTFHGSSLVANASISKRMQSELLDVLKRGLRLD